MACANSTGSRWLLAGLLLVASAGLIAQEESVPPGEPEFLNEPVLQVEPEPGIEPDPRVEEPQGDATLSAESAAAEPAETTAAPAPQTGARRSAVVSLQTTVTGNQEQPRVLYILPWQSPQAGDIDFELLDSQDAAVFGHVEREELRRELEAAGEFD